MIDPQLSWTLASLKDEAIQYLESSNIGDARRNVEWILCELLKCNRASLYAHPEMNLPPKLVKRFQEMIARRVDHEPLQYILGYTEFCGLRFEVTPDVLIPRPETEQLVLAATDVLKSLTKPAVLDIGSGSGCIPVAIKHLNPHAEIFSCDVSRPALEIARTNANQLRAEVSFFECDVLNETLPLPASQKFDLIVSNPPYIPEEEYLTLDPEVLHYEPQIALDTGEDALLFYRSISRLAQKRLVLNGTLLLETHCDYAHDVTSLLADFGYSKTKVLQDLTGRDRFVSAKRSNN